MVADHEEHECLLLWLASGATAIAAEDLEVHLKNGLKQPHVGSVVQADLVLPEGKFRPRANSPEVDQEHLTTCEREQRALALKVLIFSSLTAIGTFHVHHQSRSVSRRTHPNTLGSLATSSVVHDIECRAEQAIEKGRFASRLGSKDRHDIVIESSVEHVPFLHVWCQFRTVVSLASYCTDVNSWDSSMICRRSRVVRAD